MSHNRDWCVDFFLLKKEIKSRSLLIFILFRLLDLLKMSSEHLILADSIKKVHQQLRHDVKQSTHSKFSD